MARNSMVECGAGVQRLEDHEAYRAAAAKLAGLHEQRVETLAVIDRLGGEIGPARSSLAQREAERLLADDPSEVPDPRALEVDLSTARHQLVVLDIAITRQRATLDQARSAASVEVCRTVYPRHRAVVRRIAELFEQLRPALLEEQAIRDGLREADVNLCQPMAVAIPRFMFSGGRELRFDNWIAEMKAANYLAEEGNENG